MTTDKKFYIVQFHETEDKIRLVKEALLEGTCLVEGRHLEGVYFKLTLAEDGSSFTLTADPDEESYMKKSLYMDVKALFTAAEEDWEGWSDSLEAVGSARNPFGGPVRATDSWYPMELCLTQDISSFIKDGYEIVNE